MCRRTGMLWCDIFVAFGQPTKDTGHGSTASAPVSKDLPGPGAYEPVPPKDGKAVVAPFRSTTNRMSLPGPFPPGWTPGGVHPAACRQPATSQHPLSDLGHRDLRPHRPLSSTIGLHMGSIRGDKYLFWPPGGAPVGLSTLPGDCEQRPWPLPLTDAPGPGTYDVEARATKALGHTVMPRSERFATPLPSGPWETSGGACWWGAPNDAACQVTPSKPEVVLSAGLEFSAPTPCWLGVLHLMYLYSGSQEKVTKAVNFWWRRNSALSLGLPVIGRYISVYVIFLRFWQIYNVYRHNH